MEIQGLWPVGVHTSWPRKAEANGGKKAGGDVEKAGRGDVDGGNCGKFNPMLGWMNEKIMIQY